MIDFIVTKLRMRNKTLRQQHWIFFFPFSGADRETDIRIPFLKGYEEISFADRPL